MTTKKTVQKSSDEAKKELSAETKSSIGKITQKTMPVKTTIVMPAVSTQEALGAWAQYQDLKLKIIDKEVDIQIIEDKEFLKKSYWRKIATFFNLSVRIIEERREQIGKTIAWHFTCEAIAPNGRSAVGVGSCDAFEKARLVDGVYVNRYGKPVEPNSIHNIRATAETRAFNRAISNLVGGGEVSAEEVTTANGGKPASKPTTGGGSTFPATEKQRDFIIRLGKDLGLDEENTKKYIKQIFKLDNFSQLTISQAKEVIDRMLKSQAEKSTDQEAQPTPSEREELDKREEDIRPDDIPW